MSAIGHDDGLHAREELNATPGAVLVKSNAVLCVGSTPAQDRQPRQNTGHQPPEPTLDSAQHCHGSTAGSTPSDPMLVDGGGEQQQPGGGGGGGTSGNSVFGGHPSARAINPPLCRHSRCTSSDSLDTLQSTLRSPLPPPGHHTPGEQAQWPNDEDEVQQEQQAGDIMDVDTVVYPAFALVAPQLQQENGEPLTVEDCMVMEEDEEQREEREANELLFDFVAPGDGGGGGTAASTLVPDDPAATWALAMSPSPHGTSTEGPAAGGGAEAEEGNGSDANDDDPMADILSAAYEENDDEVGPLMEILRGLYYGVY